MPLTEIVDIIINKNNKYYYNELYVVLSNTNRTGIHVIKYVSYNAYATC